MRAGAYGLSLVSDPLSARVLKALEPGPLSPIDLRRAVGSPPQASLHDHCEALNEPGVLKRRRRAAFSGAAPYQLGDAGHALLEVYEPLQSWLAASPEGQLDLGTDDARRAVNALTDGWSSGIVRALAARPLSLGQLDRLISGFDQVGLGHLLGAMRLTGQVAVRQAVSTDAPYVVTEWLRRAAAPLAVATRWERRFAPASTAPIGRLDVEAGFLLAAPMLCLPDDIEGTCRLVVQTENGAGDRALAGVVVEVKEGRIVSCVARLENPAEAGAIGPPPAWVRALLDHEIELLDVGGDSSLAFTVLEGLHRALFRARQLSKPAP